MQNDFRSELYISTRPRCGTRLMCGKIIVTGFAKMFQVQPGTGVIQMEKKQNICHTGIPLHFESFAQTHSN